MKNSCLIAIALLSGLLLSGSLFSQTSDFDLTAYRDFLQQHKDMTSTELLEMHPAGVFERHLDIAWETVLFRDSMEIKYQLTDYEKSLIRNNGFLVTERLRKDSFIAQFHDIWVKDLPVFISTDAILHAFHFYYDEIIKKIELGFLIDRLSTLLAGMHEHLPQLAARYSGNNSMDQMLKDVDVYVTVPRILLDETVSPHFAENAPVVAEILNLIAAEQFAPYPFFSESCKDIDFSQFKPRGHYLDGRFPELAGYFRAVIWLSRIEIYLLAPNARPLICPKQTAADIQRQVIDAVLIAELVELAGVNSVYEEVEDIILLLAGEQDNVSLPNLQFLIETNQLTDASQLLDSLALQAFQDTLVTKSWAFQRILSQVLADDDPLTPNSIRPASAFLLFGQRFVIDSFVSGNVVYDKITYNGDDICRLFPKTLDILFALGNDAAAQLLVPELDEYHYSTNLAALRYLIDSYDDSFWQNSVYTMWLSAIRAINPPESRNHLPAFMQTGAWWQQKLNTQLASWTELRHDYLLYAKQSYTGALVCSYPYGYVEPIPEVYGGLRQLAEIAGEKFAALNFNDSDLKFLVTGYFEGLRNITSKLETIARKELAGEALSSEEEVFMKSLLYKDYAGQFFGWYVELISGFEMAEDFTDYLVADYHTTPTDCDGSIMGWVSHAGTGSADLAIVPATLPDGQTIAFAGPVMSYHEYTSTNFLRLTDEDWEQTYLNASSRPDWINIYLASVEGEFRGEGGQLITGIEDVPRQPGVPQTYLIAENYPNPFNTTTIISFSIPLNLTNSTTELIIYNARGQVIKTLLKETLSAGNYLTRWDGTNTAGEPVSSGLYFYEIRSGDQQFVGKMILIK